MLLVLGAGVDQRQLGRADQVGVGAVKRERARVVRDQPDHAGRKLAWLAVGERHRLLEVDIR